MKLMSIKLLVLLPVLMLLVSCGDSISELSNGKLTVEYDKSVSTDQAQALLDWSIQDRRIASGHIAVIHENNEFLIHVAGIELPDKETSNEIQNVTCKISVEVFEGSPVRFLWILDQLRNETKMLFELIKDLPPSPGWTCTVGASGKDGTLTLEQAKLQEMLTVEQAMLIDNLIGRIAFSSSFGYGNVEIHVMNADGSDLTNITNNSAWDWTPSWSPDGGKIAFSSDRDGKLEIYVMNADGSDLTRLTNNSAWDYRPAWSPDGAKIAFQSHSDGNSEIYVMNTDGSDQTRLTNNAGRDDFPEWSPDGAKIAFSSDRDGNVEIYVMNADGSGQTRLTNNGLEDNNPSWSPE